MPPDSSIYIDFHSSIHTKSELLYILGNEQLYQLVSKQNSDIKKKQTSLCKSPGESEPSLTC